MTVVQLVGAERARLRRAITGSGAALALAAALGGIALGAWALGASRWMALPRALPFVVWLLVLGLVALCAAWTRRRVTRDASAMGVAVAIEQERALRSGLVRGALEVGEQGALGRMAAADVAARLQGGTGPLAPAMQRRAQLGAVRAAGLAVAAVIALALVAANARDGLAALLHPADAWRGTLLPALRFSGLPEAVVRGERLRLRVSAPGRSTVTVGVRGRGEAWRESVVQVDARTGLAEVALPAVTADVSIVAGDGRTSTDTAVVRVTDRAFIGDVAMRAQFPAYLGRAPETLAVGEVARVPRGTLITVRGRASTALESVSLTRGVEVVRFRADGHQFEGVLRAESSGRYAWGARGASGDVADVPPAIDVDVLADSAPRVELLSPGSDSIIDGSTPVRVSVSASDDHALAGVTLRSWRERGDAGRSDVKDQGLGGGGELWTGDGRLDVAARALQPGDRLHVVAVAVDASPWRQASRSRELVLRVPSNSEQRSIARAEADSAVARAMSASAAQKSLAQRTGDAARSRSTRASGGSAGSSSSSSSMSYEAAEKARSLAQEQRALSERVSALREQAKALERSLKQAGALDSSLARQLQDVQKLLRDALTPELAAQMQQLEQSAGQLSGEQARQSLEQMAAQQRALREQLERSVDMLKRAALEGAMETLRDEAKELADEQRKAADRLSGEQTPQNGPDASELADRSRELSRDVDELAKKLKQEKATLGAEKASEAKEHAVSSAERMQRAARGEREQGAQEKGGEPQGAQKQDGAPKQGGEQQGAPKSGAQPQGAPAGAQQQGGQQGAQQQGGRQQGGQQQGGQQQGGQRTDQGAAQAAREAAREMEQAADQLAEAREGQIDAWKSELTKELDQSIQEMMQMAREQASLEQQARASNDASQMRGEQSALQQGVEKTAQRLDEAGRKSSLLSQRAQRAVGEAQEKVAQATRELGKGQQPGAAPGGSTPGGKQAADAMRDAGAALNQAAAALVRDRERANSAQSASGFSEMLQQMKELAKQQGAVNQQAGGMPMPMPGPGGEQARTRARQLAKQQRGVADQLEELGDADPTGKTEALANEARQLAQALERGAVDPGVRERQQQLYRRLLDAGQFLEQDERDESGKRESKSSALDGSAPADGSASGRGARKFEVPTWTDLRGLSAEERRLVIEYFRRLNATP
jgi:hypothetical protein